MLEQTLIEISNNVFTLGDIMQIAILVMVFISTIIGIYCFIRDWGKVTFIEEFSYRIDDGISSITGISIFIRYTGRGSLLINKIGIAYPNGERDIFSPGFILSENQPYMGYITNNLDFFMDINYSGKYVYFLETNTGKRYWSRGPLEMYSKIGRILQ